MSNNEPKTGLEKHVTTVLVSVITAIVVGIGVQTLQNSQGIARIETKIDFMSKSFEDYKTQQEKDYKTLTDRVQNLENIVYERKIK